MRLLFYTASSSTTAWKEALSRTMPEASVDVWPHSTAAADYALIWKPPPDLVARLDRVKAIFNLGAGVDGLESVVRSPQNPPLVRLEDAGMAEQMQEYVAYAVLRRYREFDAYEASQRETAWLPRRRLDKGQFRVGILGVGLLGATVAAALAAFGFPIDGWSRSRKHLTGVRSFTGTAELPAFLGQCAVLVCMLPLTEDTRGILDRATLAELPRGAYVVNVARGGLVVDEDLLALIDEGALSGAMLDVFREEPLPASHPFWHHPDITLTPHISAMTRIEESVAQICEKIRRLEAGLPISGVVDRTHFY